MRVMLARNVAFGRCYVAVAKSGGLGVAPVRSIQS